MRVDCNECGASLPVDASTRFVTCATCTSRLEIKREEAAIRTVLRPDTDDAAAGTGAPTPGASAVPIQATGHGESMMRLFIGVLLIASDLFWWFTEPSLQSRPVRIVILAGGAFLILSGLYRALMNIRRRVTGG